MILNKILSVSKTENEDIYNVEVEFLEEDESITVNDYTLYPNDPYGLAPLIREYIDDWIKQKKKIKPYKAPSIKEIREEQPPITKRALKLTLIAWDILPSSVESAIHNVKDDVQREKLLTEWDDVRFKRTGPTMTFISKQFKLSQAKQDKFWEEALGNL